MQTHNIQPINDSVLGCQNLYPSSFTELLIRDSASHISFDKIKTVVFDEYSMCVLKTKDDQYVGVGPYEESMVTLFNSKGNKIASFFEFPYKDEFEKKIDNSVRGMAYQGFLVSNPNKTKFAYACVEAEIIHFYDASLDEVKIIKKIEHGYPEYKPEKVGKSISAAIKSTNKNCFMAATATDKYVYLLYAGKSYAEYGAKSYLSEQVSVYNWEGEMVKKFLLDVPCIGLCVSPDDKLMWSTSNMPDPVIVQFDLP